MIHPTSSSLLCGPLFSHEIVPSSNILPLVARLPEGLETSSPLAAVHFLHRFRNLPKQEPWR
jgi:hypothetical protein